MLVRFLPVFGIMTLAALAACNNNSDNKVKMKAIDASASLNDLIPKPVIGNCCYPVCSA